MTDPRKPIFESIKAARNGAGFSVAEVGLIDRLLDQLNVLRLEHGIQLHPSKACLDLIKRFEGCKLTAYKCPAGVWTVGWGATGPNIVQGTRWTQEQADARLEEDVRRFSFGVSRSIDGAATSQNEFDALVSLAYNIGLGAFGGSTLLKLHRAGDKVAAGNQFVRWNKAGGRVLDGLSRRREAEANLYRGRA